MWVILVVQRSYKMCHQTHKIGTVLGIRVAHRSCLQGHNGKHTLKKKKEQTIPI